jgi:hypothetical protein
MIKTSQYNGRHSDFDLRVLALESRLFKARRAMAQAVSRRPLTAESQVRARVNPCGICGGQSGTGTGFSQSSSVLLCQYHSTVVLHTHRYISSRE